MFELVLPKACMVGHVDFKFVMNANITNIPQIQVTLLKNKAPGLGKVNGENTIARSCSLSHSQTQTCTQNAGANSFLDYTACTSGYDSAMMIETT